MIQIDGANCGGQVVRYALALSALTKRPFTVTNVRASRKDPGLKSQHLMVVKFFKEVTDAYVEGDELGSSRLLFYPRSKILRSNYVIDIGTAGSITLFLQAVLPFLIMQEKKFTLQVIGGSDVSWSIPYDYFKWVFLPILQNISQIECNLLQRGYYPKGGGKVEISLRPKQKNRIELLERGKLEYIRGVCHASSQMQRDHIADRLANAASFLLRSKATTSIDVRYAPTLSLGAGILVYAQYANYRVGVDGLLDDAIVENLGREVAQKLIDNMQSLGVDSCLLDNVLIYLALVGGSVEFSALSEHAEVSIPIIEEFLNVVFRRDGNILRVEPSEFPF